MYKHQSPTRSAGKRLTWGIVLLAVGGCLLAANLGWNIPADIWSYWPFLLIALGLAQMLLPGRPRDRFGGYWLVVVGAWGTINMFELFGLHWGNSWPIFVIAAGLRVVLGGIFGDRCYNPNDQANQNPSANSSNSWSGNPKS